MGVQRERRGVRPEASLGKSPEETVRFEVEGGSLAFGFGPAFAEPANVFAGCFRVGDQAWLGFSLHLDGGVGGAVFHDFKFFVGLDV